MKFDASNDELRVLERALKHYKLFGGREAKLDGYEVDKLLNCVQGLLISRRKRKNYEFMQTRS